MSCNPLLQTITILLLAWTSWGIIITDLPPIFNESFSALQTLEYRHDTRNKPAQSCSHYQQHNDYIVLQNGSLSLPRSGQVFETFYIKAGSAYVCTDINPRILKDDVPCRNYKQYHDNYVVLKNGSLALLRSGQIFDTFYIKAGSAYVCTDSIPRTSKDNVPCQHYEQHHDYILLQNSSLLLPRSGDVFELDSYRLVNGTAYVCAEDEEEEVLVTEPEFDFSKEFMECGHLLIEPHEYRVLDSGEVYVEPYKMTYGPKDYYMKSPEEGIYICIPHFDEMHLNLTNTPLTLAKFPATFSYVTYAGLLVSQVSLLAHLFVFCSVPTARNLPGCCLASLSLSLLAAYSCFLAIAAVDSDDQRTCADLGMSVYYFFLTSFFWMNAIAFDVWRSFRSVMRELRISSHRVPWRRFLLYSLYAWAIPGVLTCVVKVLDTNDIVPDDFKPKFGSTFCWFGQRKPLLVFFAVPLVVVMVLNAAFFLDVTCVISRAALKTSHEANLRKRFFMFMRLALIMGLTWIVGLVAGYVNHVAVWYVFIILNTLQGLFIFVVFSCSSKVKGLLCFCRKKYRHDKKRGSTSIRISHISAQV